MKKSLCILTVFFTCVFVHAQSIISETGYLDARVQTILLDAKYPIDIAEEGIRAYMKRNGNSPSLNVFAMLTYKNVALRKMAMDSSPYNTYNLRFKFETLGEGTKLSNFITMIILDNKSNVINLHQYKSILESGKIWMDEFAKYFFGTFIPEREITLTEKNIVDTKAYKIQTKKDSIETINELFNKISIYESELLQLRNTLKAQQLIFKNSIIKQDYMVDSLNKRLDSLRQVFYKRER